MEKEKKAKDKLTFGSHVDFNYLHPLYNLEIKSLQKKVDKQLKKYEEGNNMTEKNPLLINSEEAFQAAVRQHEKRKKDPAYWQKSIARLFEKLSRYGARRSAG
jgi:hypothetical protein